MFDNIFSSSPSVWAGLISGAIAIPILIHLINLVRHKTVRWAAMEFLLKSHKRNRNYVWLKQMLLLLARIAMLLIALFLLGQVGCDGDRISRLLGGRSTHHYVLLDDSFSMGQRGGNESDPTAFDRAKATLSLIAGRAKDRQNQKFTLLRYSKAVRTAGVIDAPHESSQSLDRSVAEIDNILVDSQFNALLETVKGTMEVSWFSGAIGPALMRVKTLVQERSDENAIVYILSDFRMKDWDSSKQVVNDLAKIRSTGGAIELINCATSGDSNIAVVDLEPVSSIRVAGTPLMMQLKVKNYGRDAVTKVQANISTTSFSQPNIPESLSFRKEDLPAVFIAEIGPGETQTRIFPVFFEMPGTHSISAQLNSDGLTADDRRDCTVEFVAASKVLIIDDAEQRHSNFLSLALSPDGSTGIEPVFRTKDYLRDVSPEDLETFEVIFLLDVDQLDDVAVKKVEMFCQNGGGVAFFAGPKTDFGFYNRMYGQGQGLYPIELEQSIEVSADPNVTGRDFQVETHPVFAPVNSQKTTLLDLVDIERVVVPTRSWMLKKPAGVEIIATVSGDEKRPLFVTGIFGAGRVIASTTTAGPVWNNWARNATFPPIMLLLQDYLAAGRQSNNDQLVQSPYTIAVQRKHFLPKAQILKPIADGQPRELGDLILTQAEDGTLENEISGVSANSAEDDFEVERPGVFDFWLQRVSGEYAVTRKAFNVDVSESDLRQVSNSKMIASLELAQPLLSQWNSFNPEPEVRQASSLTRFFLIALSVLLVAEQALAYSLSYHQS